MKPKLTEGVVASQLLGLSLPIAFGFLSILAFSLADTYFIARLGTLELAAISFTLPVVMILSSVAMGLGTGTASVVARAIGQGDREQVKRLTTDSLLLSLIIVSLLSSVGLWSIRPLFSTLGASLDIIPLIEDYMTIWYLGMVFLVVPMVGNSAIRASGNTIIPSLIMLLAATVNLLVDPLLIFGWGPIPALGLKGAALASLISRAGTLVASLAFLHYREHLISFTAPTWQIIKSWQSLLSIGLPSVTSNLITPFSAGVITSLMASFGSEAVAAFGLVTRLEAVALIAPLALSASLGPFVGQNLGAQLHNRIQQALKLSFWFSLAWGGLITVLLGTLAPVIAACFDSDPKVIASTTLYLTLVPISYGALGIIFNASSALNALGKPLLSLGMSFSRLLILYIPLAYLGKYLFGIAGIFGAACISNVLIGLLIWLGNNRQSHLFSDNVSVQV